MTRASNIHKEQAELLLKNKVLAAITKAIAKSGKDSLVFEKIQEDEVEEIFTSSSINEEQQMISAEAQEEQPKFIFKRPMDKRKARKINSLANELGQLFNEIKETAPIKRRRKITIYGL